jgi:hypothetical protein
MSVLFSAALACVALALAAPLVLRVFAPALARRA